MKYTELDDNEEFYRKVEYYNKARTEKLSYHYKEILKLLGEDPEREGLVKTPYRVAKAMQFMTRGYTENPEEILRSALFKEDYRQMVIVKDIEIYSLCEHHMLPFIGHAHVAYIPNGYITGLSKIARVVEAFSRRLQVQERLTNDIKNCIQNTLNPLGVPTRVCLFHGENHELSRNGKPKHRVRRLKEITRWFDRYLKNC